MLNIYTVTNEKYITETKLLQTVNRYVTLENALREYNRTLNKHSLISVKRVKDNNTNILLCEDYSYNKALNNTTAKGRLTLTKEEITQSK